MNVFRTATTQAIREIIADHGTTHRFGMSLTENDIEAICSRVVDLFEMTLNLRAQLNTGTNTSNPHSPENGAAKPLKASRWEQEPASLPTSKAASELYELSHLERRPRSDALPATAPVSDSDLDFRLPRKRVSVSVDERNMLMKRA
jgi:hypothetical protein